jgi:membrane protease YdiL (CAAX protease family)
MEKLRELAHAFTAWDWACVAYSVGLGVLGLVWLRRWFREEQPDQRAPSSPIEALLGLGCGLFAFGGVYPEIQKMLVKGLMSEQILPSVSSHLQMGLVAQLVATGLMLALWIGLRAVVAWGPTAPTDPVHPPHNLLSALPRLRPGHIWTALVCVLGLGLAGAVLWKLLHATWALAAAHGFPFAAPADVPQPVVQLVLDVPMQSRTFMMLALTVSVGAPIMEELAFRGMIYPGLKALLPPSRWPAVILTGLLFATVHLSWSAALPLLGFGCFLCLVRDRFGLLTCIAVHAAFNFTTLLWLKLAPNASSL